MSVRILLDIGYGFASLLAGFLLVNGLSYLMSKWASRGSLKTMEESLLSCVVSNYFLRGFGSMVKTDDENAVDDQSVDDSAKASPSTQESLPGILKGLQKDECFKSSVISDILGYIAEGVSAGKLLRPMLASACASSAKWGSQVGELAELVHVASLLHDDVVDESDERRGRPSVAKLHGSSLAVLSGDALVGLVVQRLATMKSATLLRAFAFTLQALVIGEMSQVWINRNFVRDVQVFEKTGSLKNCTAFRQLNHQQLVILTELITQSGYPCSVQASVYDLYVALCNAKSYYKTGALFEFCTYCGSRFSVAHGSLGRNIGLGFQLADDLIDFKLPSDDGLQKSYGKPTGGSDVEHGVITWPIIVACQRNASVAEKILTCAHNKKLSTQFVAASAPSIIPLCRPYVTHFMAFSKRLVPESSHVIPVLLRIENSLVD